MTAEGVSNMTSNEEDRHDDEEEIIDQQPTTSPTTLSKSWSVSSAHVPTYTGGKVTHCYTRGLRNLEKNLQDQNEDDENDNNNNNNNTNGMEQEHQKPLYTPFLLLPVSGDLAIVDSQRGIKICTVRENGASESNDNYDDEDDDDFDADAIICYALSFNDEILLTCSQNQLIRQYILPVENNSNESTSSLAELTLQQPKSWGKSQHTLPVTHIEFHKSNIFVATGSVDGTVRVWDVRGMYVTHVFRPMESGGIEIGGSDGTGGRHAVTALSWRFDISHLIIAIGRDNGSICIHDLRDSGSTNNAIVLNDHMGAVTNFDWGPLGNGKDLESIFVSTGRDQVVNTWKITEMTASTSSEHKKGKKKKKDVLTNNASKKITYQRIHTLPVYEQVEGMIILPHMTDKPDENLIVATAGSKGLVRLWKATTNTSEAMTISGFVCIAEQPMKESFGSSRGGYMDLRYINYRSSGQQKQKQLIAADAEHNLSFLSLQGSNMDDDDSNDRAILSINRTIVGHNDEILDLKIIPQSTTTDTHDNGNGDSKMLQDQRLSQRIVVCTNSAQVRLFNLDNFSCEVLDGHKATVLCVDVSPCGRFLSTCGKDKTMRIWYLVNSDSEIIGTKQQDNCCVAVATGHTEAIGATTLSRKIGRYEVGGNAASNGAGAFVITASKDRTIKRWNLPGSQELHSYAAAAISSTSESSDDGILPLRAFVSARAHEKDINIVSIAPNDSLVATGSQDKTVKLWRSTDLTLRATLKGHKRGVWDCQFSPFDRVIATSSGDKSVKLWSLSDYSCVRTFQGHVSSVLRVRFLCAGLQLISCGADGLIKLWTIRNNECVSTMDGHNDKIWALDLSPDGTKLVTGGADSQIVVWADTTQEEQDAKRQQVEQNILMEQRLANHLRHKEYGKALEISLELDKPRQTLKVLNSIIENDIAQHNNSKNKKELHDGGLAVIQSHVKGWSMERVLQILRYCREWNTRGRNCHIAMLVLKAIVTTIPVTKLAQTDGLPETLAGMTPYAERHFDRLDKLCTSSYLIDFALYSMNDGLFVDHNEDLLTSVQPKETFAEWESNSKLVLPPKHIDGRIQVGGSAIVGGLQEGGNAPNHDKKYSLGEILEGDSDEDDSSAVMTVGDSDDSSSSSSDSDDGSIE